jgi:uncharacterized protein
VSPFRCLGDNRLVTGLSYFGAPGRQAATLEEVAHRPWPVPAEPWAQAQTRLDVLFAHWRVPPGNLARLLPPGLALDTYAGDAWLGVIPFRLSSLRLRGLPALPGLTFEQLDIRTYVTVDDRPGVWLCSVDVSNPLLLEAAKRTHRLPAYRARVRAETEGGWFAFDATRDDLSFGARYREQGEPLDAHPGSLEHFLTERYCIYTADGGRLYRTELHHPPWALKAAEASIGPITLAPVALEGEPHLLYAATQDVLVWPVEEA